MNRVLYRCQCEIDPAQWPRASSLHRYSRCPQSFDPEAEAQRDAEPDKDREFGVNVHAILAGKAISTSPDEEICVRKCDELRENAVGLWNSEDAKLVTFRERRLLMMDASTMPAVIFSGMVDYIAIDYKAKRALIIDYKTGWGETESEESNMQLRAYAALCAVNFDVNEVSVKIVQPFGKSVAQPPVTYTDQDLDQAIGEVFKFSRRAMTEAGYADGDWCKYCPKLKTCPHLLGVAEESALDLLALPKPITELPDDKLSLAFGTYKRAEKIIGVLRDEVKKRLKAGQRIPGFNKKPDATVRVISDLGLVAERAMGYGVKQAAIIKAASMDLKSLSTLLREATDAKGVDLKNIENACLDGAIEEGSREGAVVWDRIEWEKHHETKTIA